MEKELAISIIKAWQDDLRCSDVNWPKEMEYIPFKYRIRPILAQRNVLANNALWDGMPNKALSLLMKYGFKDNKRKNDARVAERYAAKKFQATQMANSIEYSRRHDGLAPVVNRLTKRAR